MFFWIAAFWLNLLALAYVYAGYPLMAWLAGGLMDRKVTPDDKVHAAEKAHAAGGAQPATRRARVTVLIAAFNEARHIEATVRNKLAQDYPADLLDVIVISDASDDGTDTIVRGIGSPRVRLIRQEPRAGKTSALNLAMPETTGDIIVFSDANSLYAPDTVAMRWWRARRVRRCVLVSMTASQPDRVLPVQWGFRPCRAGTSARRRTVADQGRATALRGRSTARLDGMSRTP